MGRKRKHNKQQRAEPAKKKRCKPSVPIKINFLELSHDVQVFVLTFLPLRLKLHTVQHVSKHLQQIVYESFEQYAHVVGFSKNSDEDYVKWDDVSQLKVFLEKPYISEHLESLKLAVNEKQLGKLTFDWSILKRLKHLIATFSIADTIIDLIPNLQYAFIPSLFIHHSIALNYSIQTLVLNSTVDNNLATYIRQKFVNLQWLEFIVDKKKWSNNDPNNRNQIIKILCSPIENYSDIRALKLYGVASHKQWYSDLKQLGQNLVTAHFKIDDAMYETLLYLAKNHSLRNIDLDYCPDITIDEVEELLELGCTINICTSCFWFQEACPCQVGRGNFANNFHTIQNTHDEEEKTYYEVKRLQKSFGKRLVIGNEKSGMTYTPYKKEIQDVRRSVNPS